MIKKSRWPRCIVPVRDAETHEFLFDLILYGKRLSDLTWIGPKESGAKHIHAALKRRGINSADVFVSFFELREEVTP